MKDIIYHDYEYIIMSPPFCKPFFRFLEDRYSNYPIVGAEIGVFTGDGAIGTLECCSTLNIARFYLIDPYQEYGEFNQQKLDEVFPIANSRLRKHGNKVIPLWMPSHIAHNSILEQLDFVYIDGDHSYQGVKSDCNIYYDKVKTGGVIGGHDYILGGGRFEVLVRAVDELIECKNAQLHYVSPEWWIIKE